MKATLKILNTVLKNELIPCINSIIQKQGCQNKHLKLTAIDHEVINFKFTVKSENPRLPDTETPLISELIRTDNLKLASSLIEGGITDINIKDTGGRTPLFYAMEKNNQPLINLIKAKGGRANEVLVSEHGGLDYDPLYVPRVLEGTKVAKDLELSGDFSLNFDGDFYD